MANQKVNTNYFNITTLLLFSNIMLITLKVNYLYFKTKKRDMLNEEANSISMCSCISVWGNWFCAGSLKLGGI